jgi:hypothetical protein
MNTVDISNSELYKNWNDNSDFVFEAKMAEIEARLLGML